MSQTTRTDFTRLASADVSSESSTSSAGANEAVPRCSTLDGFAEEISLRGGVNITGLEPITPLIVRTENTVYRIMVLEPYRFRILVQGGSYFPEATPAHLQGSGFGGSLLKQGWIGQGLRMEICTDDNRIITSRVRSMEIEADASLPGPF